MDIISLVLLLIIAAVGLLLAFVYGKSRSKVFDFREALTFMFKSKQEVSLTADYDKYAMGPLEYLSSLLFAALVLFILGYIFYRSVILALMLTPFSALFPRIRRKQIIANRKKELKLQFRDALQSISSSLYAGKSMESAMKAALSDLMIQYDADTYIILELAIIIRKLEANETIEKAFWEFAERSRLEEVEGFAEVLEICKRTGGNLITAMRTSTEIISDKIEVLNDIAAMLAQKKLEQHILTVMPIALIFMLSNSAKDFMQPVFTEAVGRIAMTISIVLFAVAYFIAAKITDIEV